MARIYYEPDVRPEAILEKRVGVVGYGNHGHAHAQNLKDSGVDVRVGLPAASGTRARAQADGLRVETTPELTRWADVLMFCTADVPMAEIYRREVLPDLRAGQTLLFAHGFNIRYGRIAPPPGVGVGLVAPKGAGVRLRAEFLAGAGLFALVATGEERGEATLDLALSYAWALGCARAGILLTTFAEETETDLFGEQAVLCGGLAHLVMAGFDTLVDAGYQPEAAYFECLHETKLIVDILYRAGLSGLRAAISDTAEHGMDVAGPRVVGEPSRRAMRELLDAIQDGSFAREWIAEAESGAPGLREAREATKRLRIEEVGAKLRAMMPNVVGD